MLRKFASGLLVILAGLISAGSVLAGELVLTLDKGEGVVFVGAMRRWDIDGNPLKPVNPKAKIDSPEVSARATALEGNRWKFSGLPSGRYDLVILKKDRVRIEGFHYPPILEFDPFFPALGKDPGADTRARIVKDIARGRHYENKVAPLYLAGDETQVRVLVQLIRDLPTSYDAEVGFPVATVRHEIWQYTYRYGAWSKERSTKILDRLLLPRREFHGWTWVWEPRLGGIEVGSQAVNLTYTIPAHLDAKTVRGWLPPSPGNDASD
jgi:hypothetical protein